MSEQTPKISASGSGKSMLHSTAAMMLETGLRQLLQLDPDSTEYLATLRGKVLAMTFTDLGFSLYFIFGESVQVVSYTDAAVNTELRGSSVAFAAMALRDQGADALFKGEINLLGDIFPGEQFQRLLRNIDIDWEELLSKFTGDIVAHKVGNLARRFIQWGRSSAQILQQDAVEYAQHEIRVLPTLYEMQNFLSEVDTLRGDVDRLAVRMTKLVKAMPRSKREGDSDAGAKE